MSCKSKNADVIFPGIAISEFCNSSMDISLFDVTIGPYPIPKLPPDLKIVYSGKYAHA